ARPARLGPALTPASARANLSERNRGGRGGPGGAAFAHRPLPPRPRGRALHEAGALARLTPSAVPEGQGSAIDAGTKQGRNFAAERAEPGRNVFEAVSRHVGALKAAGKRVVIALWSEGARDRMGHVLADHALAEL